MATPNPNSHQVLCAEILAEARREAEQIVQSARQQAETLLAQAAAEAQQARQQKLASARTEAARRRELLLAAVPLETSRLRLARTETLLRSIYEEVRRRLLARNGFDYPETLVSLAAEALARMAGNAFVLKLSLAERPALGEGLAQEIARRAGNSRPLSITVSDAPAITEAGLIIEDVEGRQVWDNRLTARLERMWPELRRQIASAPLWPQQPAPPGGSS